MSGEPPKSQSWWQTLPGILTAVAAIITASTGLFMALNNSGVFSRDSKLASPIPTPTVALSTSTPAKPETSSVVEVPASTEIDALERRLKAVNIQFSTGSAAEREKVRGYFDGPEAPYYLLAVTCIQVLGNQRLKKTGYLDMIDKHFSKLGDESIYTPVDGKLNLEKVKKAMVEAQRDYHSDQVKTFEEIVEPR
ncbi:MAG: hypothetical protein JST85_27430 [Acidobacteria bacterium]|nr:hypothetical protein [Acidobacteriota bacterium]